MGTLSASEDNTMAYEVKVEASNLNGGKVEVETGAKGNLTSGENTLAFANDFGTQEAAETTTLHGNIKVTAADVAKAAAGNYTGTADFTISYYAAQ